MSELSAQAGSEGYGACADEAQGRSPCTEHQRRKEPEPSEVPALTSQSAHTWSPDHVYKCALIGNYSFNPLVV